MAKTGKGGFYENDSGQKMALHGRGEEKRVAVSVRLPLSVYKKLEELQGSLGHRANDRPNKSMSQLYIDLLESTADLLNSEDRRVLSFLEDNSKTLKSVMADRAANIAAWEARKAQIEERNKKGKSTRGEVSSPEQEQIKALQMEQESLIEKVTELYSELEKQKLEKQKLEKQN